LYCNVNGKTKVFAVGYSVLLKHWDSKNQRARVGCPDFSIINAKLSGIQNLINNIITRAELDKRQIVTDDFSQIFHKGNTSTSIDLVEWMENDLKYFSNKYAKETVHTYAAQLSKLKSFNKSIKFCDITPAWWLRYERFMIDKGNIPHTRHKCFTHIKCFINKAVEAGIIAVNPLRGVKVKSGQSNRQFMSVADLRKLEAYYLKITNIKDKNVLQYFLFSCYTGLRFTDVKNLKWLNIRDGYLELKFHKTAKNERLPLNKSALALLPERKALTDKVFNVVSNQKTNDYLELILKAAELKQHLTFHCARHTFATITLELSGDIATVSKLLGHSDIATTQIYARVLDQNKKSVIDLWDKLIPDQKGQSSEISVVS
jgi:integrase